MKNRRGGFTLVELVVAIVIMGILAAVAVPAYNGYVAKANEAGDLQLLAAVNNAWAAACLDCGVSRTDTDAEAALTGEVGAMRVSFVQTKPDSDNGIPASFMSYFAGSADLPFKYYTELLYDTATGSFGGIRSVAKYNGSLMAISSRDLNTFKKSTFAQMEPEELMGDVARLTEAASKAIALDKLKKDPGFLAYLSSVGVDTANLTDAQWANALVLYSASKSEGLDGTALSAEGLGSQLIDKVMGDDYGEQMAAMSLMFGVFTGYVSSDYASDAEKNQYNSATEALTDKNAFLAMMDRIAVQYDENGEVMYDEDTGEEMINENAIRYLKEKGNEDVLGYLSCMNIINSNIKTAGAQSVVENGFTDPNLVSMLNKLYK